MYFADFTTENLFEQTPATYFAGNKDELVYPCQLLNGWPLFQNSQMLYSQRAFSIVESQSSFEALTPSMSSEDSDEIESSHDSSDSHSDNRCEPVPIWNNDDDILPSPLGAMNDHALDQMEKCDSDS